MLERMKNLHNELCKIRKKQQRLKQLIEDSVDAHGVMLDDGLHNDFKETVKECETQMEGATPTLFKWVFWQQQMEASSKTDSRGMRWHPLMINGVFTCNINLKLLMRLYVNQSLYHCLPNALFVISHIMLNQLMDFLLKLIGNYAKQQI